MAPLLFSLWLHQGNKPNLKLYPTNYRQAWQCIPTTKCLELVLRSHFHIERATGLTPAIFGDSKSWKCTAESEFLLNLHVPAGLPASLKVEM